MTAKTFNTPLPSGRKAFGAVNKKISTPAVNTQEKKLLKPQVGINSYNLKLMWHICSISNYTCIDAIFCSQQETKVKHAPHSKVEDYPEIEKFIPYDPLGNYDISHTITFRVWDLKV